MEVRKDRVELAGALLDTSDALKAFRECSGGLSGTLRRGLGSSRRALGSLRGRSGHPSKAILGGSETAGGENGDMLENDDPYGTFAMISTSLGLRNEAKCSRRRNFRTSEYGREQKASREASWERLGSSKTAFGTAGWQKVEPPRVHRGSKVGW